MKHACDCFVEYTVRSCSHIKEFCFESSFIYNTYTYNFVNIVFSTIKTCMIYRHGVVLYPIVLRNLVRITFSNLSQNCFVEAKILKYVDWNVFVLTLIRLYWQIWRSKANKIFWTKSNKNVSAIEQQCACLHKYLYYTFFFL